MVEFLVANSHRIVAVVAILSGILGWVCRVRRNDHSNQMIFDAFSGSTIYSTLYLLVILWFLDRPHAGDALVHQSEMLTLTFGASLLYFSKDFYDKVIKGEGSASGSGGTGGGGSTSGGKHA